MDDFGTGNSSLSRLHALPVDVVKIDKSLVDALAGGGPAPLVAATISMAHSLGLQTVAEGVETTDQLPLLRLYGSDSVQGYLFGRPPRRRCRHRVAAPTRPPQAMGDSPHAGRPGHH